MPLIYGGWGKGFVIVASLGGAPDHPFWYKNLDADPNAHIQVGYNHFDVTARVAKGDERKILWDMMVGILPQYVEYAKSTEGKREIPVVVLDPKYDG